MTTTEFVTLYWLLPSLITFLMLLHAERKQWAGLYGKTPQEYDQSDWVAVIVATILYPFALGVLLAAVIESYGSFLIKEI